MVLDREFLNVNNSPISSVKYLYFVTNSNRTNVEVGITDDIFSFARNCKRKPDLFEGFVENSNRLVYFEEFNDQYRAKERLVALRKWTRAQKEKLIRRINPDWVDLSVGILKEPILGNSLLKNPISKPGYHFN